MKLAKSNWMYKWVMKLVASKTSLFNSEQYTDKQILDACGYIPYDKCQFIRVAFLYPLICFSLLAGCVGLSVSMFVSSLSLFGAVSTGLGVLSVLALFTVTLIAVAAFFAAIYGIEKGFEKIGQWIENRSLNTIDDAVDAKNKFCSSMEYVDDEK